MKVIYKPIQGGKTTELIRISAETGAYIVCHSFDEAHRIFEYARILGLDIPLPFTYDEFKRGQYAGHLKLLLDNVEDYISDLNKSDILAVTITDLSKPQKTKIDISNYDPVEMSWVDVYNCPNCKKEFLDVDRENYPNFCCWCGIPIEWIGRQNEHEEQIVQESKK